LISFFHGAAGAWAIENVLEELDEGNEFYHDQANGILYYAPNASAAGAAPQPPADGDLVAVYGKVIVSVNGSQQQPVRNVSLRGLVIRDAAPTYM
jgi:hypothetical protein